MSTKPVEAVAPVTAAKRWGFTMEELAKLPIVYRDDLFAGKTVLVTGGSGDFGRAITFLFARLGANVMICGRNAEKLAATAAGVHRLLGRDAVTTRAMSIRDPEMCDALIAETWERYGALDLVVNNAGGQFPQAAIDFSVKGWLAVIDTNLNGTWFMMQAAARQWRERKAPGNIVNIVANIWRGMPQVAHTCAARAGVVYLSKSVSVEWAPLNIRVNCVSPGSINSEGLNVYPESAAQKFIYSNPMMTLGDSHDVAQAVVYLAAPSGKFVTGEVVVVDGGNNQWGDVWPAGIPPYFKVNDR